MTCSAEFKHLLLRAVLGVFALASWNVQSQAADSCDAYKTPSEVLAGLTSDQQVPRVEAKTCGLASDDRSVRGVVLSQVLQGMTSMSFDVQPQEKDPDGATLVNKMPAFVVINVTWSKDGRNFRGNGYPYQIGDVVGNFLGESLSISFPAVVLPVAKQGDPPMQTSCSATLTLLKDAGEIKGMMRCQGMAPRFLISLGL